MTVSEEEEKCAKVGLWIFKILLYEHNSFNNNCLNKTMITLYFMEGNILLYNVDDWLALRKTHRIIGEIIGNSSHVPSLPLKLSSEEALLLLNRNIVEIREVIEYGDEKTDIEEFEKQMLECQIIEYKTTRKIQIENVLDRIVAQRRKLNDNRSKEEILKEELEKTPPVTKDNIIWPIFLSSNIDKSNTRLINSDIIKTFSTGLKFQTFQDLHDRGYYITGGTKFGGDFLVYFGDPICHHAIFIVKCIESEQKISTMEIVAFGRLGTSVKKRAVLASMMDEQICYLTINWIDA